MHVSSLPGDFFVYDENTYEMVGRESGVTYKLGQKLTVRVRGVDRLLKTIDFEIHWEEQEDR